jgi:hypothetical protein
MSVRTLDRSFASGELTPELFGRIDLGKFQSGLATCRNFITLPHGPAVNRPGFQFVHETKNSAAVSRLIPFSYNSTQTLAIEVGAGYFRFHTQGAVVLAGSPAAWSSSTAYVVGGLVSYGGIKYYCILANTNHTPPNATYWYALPATGEYEIPNNYAAADLINIHYVQSVDIMTLVHPNYPPQELRRLGGTNWTLTPIVFSAPTNAPTGVTATPTGSSTAHTYQYVVTTINTTGLQESIPSTASASITNDLTVTGNKNTISWTAVSGAAQYNVYKYSNGLYGYIGSAGGTSFVDNNITADISTTPPINDVVMASTGNYPAAVSYYQQRRCFAGTATQPQNMWMTRSGTESDMSYTIPTKDDNRVAFHIAAREASSIQHIVPVASLVLLTSSTAWMVTDTGAGAITPTSISIKPQSYMGANNVTPVIVGNSVLYPQANGGRIREMSYNWQANGYLSNDVSLLAPHLFDYNTIVDMAFSRATYPILWAVSSNGQLLGMTYVPEQQIASWHHHDTDGTFEAVTTITENGEDVLYAIVNRTINGVTKRYVEMLHTRNFATLSDAFFVDCGATYNGTATTTLSGLTWLEGKTVSILADGAVMPQAVVTGGSITLQQAASKIQVGLPITADLKTLPIAAQTDGAFAQGKNKNVNAVWLRLNRSSGIWAGPLFTALKEFKQRTTESYGSPPNLISDEIKIVLSPSWGYDGQVCLRQIDPLPLTVSSMTIEVAIGG